MKKLSAFVIAGTHSGCGKTTVSLGIMSALKRKGLNVQGFKVGPDFIDPGHHRIITENPSYNLDGWMISEKCNKKIFLQHSCGADVVVVEGVMGLYDGASGNDDAGSTAQIAKWLNLPVILVIDARSMARSVAALLLGYTLFDPEVNIVGVIFNRVSSYRHAELIEDAVKDIKGIEIFGFLPEDKRIEIPSRHLGLITAEDMSMQDSYIRLLSEWTDSNVDLYKLLNVTTYIADNFHFRKPAKRLTKVKIGIAKDNAFCFYYEDNLRLLEKEGAELIPFSPINDSTIPECHALIFGGGYPELYCEKLSSNLKLMGQIKSLSEKGMPIYAECGGFMYLMDAIVDMKGKEYKMVGIFPFKSQLRKGLRALGYREIVVTQDSILGPCGTKARGHEFHYSDIVYKRTGNYTTIYSVLDKNGKEVSKEGFVCNNTLGSYIHLHFCSNPMLAKYLVKSAEKYKLKGSSS